MKKLSPQEVEILAIKERCKAKVAEILPDLEKLSPEKRKEAARFLDEAIKSQQVKAEKLSKLNLNGKQKH